MISVTEFNIENEIDTIHHELHELRQGNKKLFLSSSFQTQSVPLLHTISLYSPQIPVVFLDTGFLFPETYRFRDELVSRLNLNLKVVSSTIQKTHQRNNRGALLFTSDPDYCCQINKIDPMEAFSSQYDVWISGVRADQSSTRASLDKYRKNKTGLLRYHPVLHWNAKHVYLYRKHFNLPAHPLEEKGYLSIGCMPCTEKYLDTQDQERTGRWAGLSKNECGLHTQLG